MYLITYQQWTGGDYVTANSVIKIHPFDWIIEAGNRCPHARPTLLNWWELTEYQFKKLSEM